MTTVTGPASSTEQDLGGAVLASLPTTDGDVSNTLVNRPAAQTQQEIEGVCKKVGWAQAACKSAKWYAAHCLVAGDPHASFAAPAWPTSE
jgi:hypothetical protein